MTFSRSLIANLLIGLVILFAGCGPEPEPVNWDSLSTQDSTDITVQITGLSGPESVRLDPDQQVYFISNFNGPGSAADSNGFITKASLDGKVEALQFMTGTEAHPLHSPRGMYITGDTLWVCDVKGVHGFHRKTGKQLQFVDFTAFDPGFLNDIVATADQSLYVTDTGRNRVYQIKQHKVRIALDSLDFGPNGITRNPHTQQLVLAPWGGSRHFLKWDRRMDHQSTLHSEQGGYFDGIEPVSEGYLVSSQQDSMLYHLTNKTNHMLIQLPGRPADIGWNPERKQVAIPFVAKNRVDIWTMR
jgi:hypothetical protein